MSKHIDEHHLRGRGWSDEEIEHAKGVLNRAEENKHPFIVSLDRWVFSALLLISIIGTVIFALYVVPLFLLFPAGLLYPVLGILGLSLGVLYTIVVRDLHWLHNHHHTTALIILPLASIISFVLVLTFVTRYQAQLPQIFGHSHNIVLVALTYAAALLLPYAYALVRRNQ